MNGMKWLNHYPGFIMNGMKWLNHYPGFIINGMKWLNHYPGFQYGNILGFSVFSTCKLTDFVCYILYLRMFLTCQQYFMKQTTFHYYIIFSIYSGCIHSVYLHFIFCYILLYILSFYCLIIFHYK